MKPIYQFALAVALIALGARLLRDAMLLMFTRYSEHWYGARSTALLLLYNMQQGLIPFKLILLSDTLLGGGMLVIMVGGVIIMHVLWENQRI